MSVGRNLNMKVSIICPAYNSEKYIEQTLDSIFSQTLQDFEIIIVDDCSKDKTIDIVKKYNDPRIKLFNNTENKGAAYCRNLALEKASGEYIAFLDTDDLWLPTKLEKQIKFMEENKYDFSYTPYEEIDENGQKMNRLVNGPKKITKRKFRHMDYVGCLTVMYKRSIYPNLHIPNDLMKNNDYAMWLLLSEKANCYLLNECLASYRRHTSGSISSGKKSKLFKYHIELYKKLYGFGKVKAFLYSFRNVCFYYYKRVKYVKKVRK